MRKIILALFLFASLTGYIYANGAKERYHIDYLIFRQIWPQPTCLFPEGHSCSIPQNVTTWVVHGLWPSENGEIGPSFCNKSLPFNPDKVKPLMPLLLKYWPNLYTDTPMDSFWAHEWEKHGTCSLSATNITNEYEYFSFSLNLRDKFDFGPILSQKSIVPHDSLLYDAQKIKNAIQTALGVSPYLVCFVTSDGDMQYLSQMQICLTKQYEIIDCPNEAVELVKIFTPGQTSVQEIECHDKLPIAYPKIKPTKIH